MTEQTKALRLADRLDLRDYYEFDAGLHCPDAAAELRRLDAMVGELVGAIANLISVKGRHNTEIAYQRLVAAYDKAKGQT